MLKKYSILLLCPLFMMPCAYATKFIFNPKLIDGAGSNIDLSLFNKNQEQPGLYYVNLVLNGQQVDARKINFNLYKQKNGSNKLIPCLSPSLLSSYGINLTQFISKKSPKLQNCFNITTIPGAQINFNFNKQTLFINIPQIYLKTKYTGMAPKRLWNNGINAFFVNYNITTNYAQQTTGQYTTLNNNSELELYPGLNIGAWRIRGNESWTKNASSKGKWRSSNIYATRGIYNLNSRITLGQSYTSGDVFTSFPFEGVMLSSDTQMVPSNQYTYSPIVRGVAKTQSRIQISENGTILYNQIVAPGPFSISSFTPLNSNGVLNVTVWGTGGEIHRFNVPFSTPIIALKQNYFEYNIVIGQYGMPHRLNKKNTIYQAELIYGLPYNITGYTGFQLADGFSAYSVGLGISMGYWGGLSIDDTINSSPPHSLTTQLGNQLRLRYNTRISKWNTSVSLLDTYSNIDYTTLSHYFNNRATPSLYALNDDAYYVLKNSLQLNVNQSLSEQTNFFFNGTLDNYWNTKNDTVGLNTGLSINLPKFNNSTLSLQFSSTHVTQSNNKNNQIVSIFLNIPLDNYLGTNTQVTYRNLTPLHSESSSHVIDLSGSSKDNTLHWDLGQEYQKEADQTSNSGYINGSWNTADLNLSASYNYSDHYAAWGMSAAGGILFYNDNRKLDWLLSHTIQGTSALIEAPGASDASISGVPNTITNKAGDSIASYLMPYQKNNLSIDPVNLPHDVSIDNNNISVIPTQGAIVLAKFKTEQGAHALIKLIEKNGTPFPFGSIVINEKYKTKSIIGINGETYITGLGKSGNLLAKSNKYQCMIHYTLPKKQTDSMDGIYEFNEKCQ